MRRIGAVWVDAGLVGWEERGATGGGRSVLRCVVARHIVHPGDSLVHSKAAWATTVCHDAIVAVPVVTAVVPAR